MEITFLGTGANGGTPQLDCNCQNCSSAETRKRSSILIKVNGKRIILDCGPDFKQQLVSADLKLQGIDCLAITHLHWDHCAGLVELSAGRAVEVPVIVPTKIKRMLKAHPMFSFLFRLGFGRFQDSLKGINIQFIAVKHDTNFPTFAIKVSCGKQSVLYVPDLQMINKRLLTAMKSSSLIIFDGTFTSPNPFHHLAINQSLPILAKLNQPVIFSHINHSENTQQIVDVIKPFGFKLAHDGMTFQIKKDNV